MNLQEFLKKPENSSGITMSESIRTSIEAAQEEERKSKEALLGQLYVKIIKQKNTFCCQEPASGLLVTKLKQLRQEVKETRNKILEIQEAYDECFWKEGTGDPKKLYIAMLGEKHGPSEYVNFCNQLGINSQ